MLLIVENDLNFARFLLETVRAVPVFTPFGKHLFGTMSYSMVLSIPLVVLGIVLWVVFGAQRDWKTRRETMVPAAAPVAG